MGRMAGALILIGLAEMMLGALAAARMVGPKPGSFAEFRLPRLRPPEDSFDRVRTPFSIALVASGVGALVLAAIALGF